MSKLLNYTSSVASEKSIVLIERMLAKAGALNISKSYDNERVSAIWFSLKVNGQILNFRLPARVAAVERVLLAQYKQPHRDTWKRVAVQADRTAWKILHDWCAAQLALIQLEQAEPTEVFLPYLYNPETDKTLFDTIKESGYKMLTKGK